MLDYYLSFLLTGCNCLLKINWLLLLLLKCKTGHTKFQINADHNPDELDKSNTFVPKKFRVWQIDT